MADKQQKHIKEDEYDQMMKNWRSWGSWFSWGSPVGLGIFLVALAVAVWILAQTA